MSSEKDIQKLFDHNRYSKEQLSLYLHFVPFVYLIVNDKKQVIIKYVQFDSTKSLGLTGTILN